MLKTNHETKFWKRFDELVEKCRKSIIKENNKLKKKLEKELAEGKE